MLSPVARKFRKTSLSVLASYFVLFPAADYLAQRIHPAGVGLWLLAGVPLLPLLIVFVLMGYYLRDEKDEYKRDLMVRCLLWGTGAGVLANLFFGYLRVFGWKGQLFPFTEFFVFMVAMLAAKLSYRAADRVPADE